MANVYSNCTHHANIEDKHNENECSDKCTKTKDGTNKTKHDEDFYRTHLATKNKEAKAMVTSILEDEEKPKRPKTH